jgi:mannitol-1-phosphate 5-dehydrogenase
MQSAVQFGAGNIGRGFMGQLFWEAGLTTVHVDTDSRLVDLINSRGSYTLRLLDAYTRTQRDLLIDRVQAVRASDRERVAAHVAEAGYAGTAVGVKNLTSLAPLLAAGIAARRERNPRPMDIYLCENVLDAARTLREATLSLLEPGLRGWAEGNIGFVGTSVARMVPPPRVDRGSDDPLLVVADAYHELPFDAAASRAAPLPAAGVHGVANFAAEVERKLFTHNLGHAALAYLGHLKGFTYVHEPFDDPELSAVFDGALEETARALLSRHAADLDAAQHREILRDVRIRFSNPLLMDTVRRVARDPMRKLGPQDRLVGSVRLCLTQGVFPRHVLRVCAAALLYDDAEDPDAVRLQELIRGNGVEGVLAEVSGIAPESEEGREIIRSYRELARPGGRDRGSRSP